MKRLLLSAVLASVSFTSFAAVEVELSVDAIKSMQQSYSSVGYMSKAPDYSDEQLSTFIQQHNSIKQRAGVNRTRYAELEAIQTQCRADAGKFFGREYSKDECEAYRKQLLQNDTVFRELRDLHNAMKYLVADVRAGNKRMKADVVLKQQREAERIKKQAEHDALVAKRAKERQEYNDAVDSRIQKRQAEIDAKKKTMSANEQLEYSQSLRTKYASECRGVLQHDKVPAQLLEKEYNAKLVSDTKMFMQMGLSQAEAKQKAYHDAAYYRDQIRDINNRVMASYTSCIESRIFWNY